MKNLLLILSFGIFLMSCDKEPIEPPVNTKTDAEVIQENYDDMIGKWYKFNAYDTIWLNGNGTCTQMTWVDGSRDTINSTWSIYLEGNQQAYLLYDNHNQTVESFQLQYTRD